MRTVALLSFCCAVSLPCLAEAHAFLDHAVPGVGSSVSTSPAEIELDFTQAVLGALSKVQLTSAGGAAVPLAKPVVAGSVVRARLGRALPAGTYVVHWRVVAGDTHPTSGTFKFTVAP